MRTESGLPMIHTPRISEAAYQILREKIVSKEFAPGQRLDLNAIEKKLGISRTPLKEALLRLEAEGLIVIVPRSGTFISDPGPEEIAESFDVRAALEIYAVKLTVERATDKEIGELRAIVQELADLAAKKDRDAIYPRYLALDHQFHQQLVALAGNERLCQAHVRENVHAQMARIRYRRSERELDLAEEEHKRIIAALEARDAETAQAEMGIHLMRAKRSILADMEVAA